MPAQDASPAWEHAPNEQVCLMGFKIVGHLCDAAATEEYVEPHSGTRPGSLDAGLAGTTLRPAGRPWADGALPRTKIRFSNVAIEGMNKIESLSHPHSPSARQELRRGYRSALRPAATACRTLVTPFG
jgi:hypothetical protein